MITEDEFKDLTETLEVVGHYDPSVKDMLTHIRDSDVKWVGFHVEYPKTSNPEECHSEIRSTNFPDSGRFEKAIWEFMLKPHKFSSVIKKMGMRIDDPSKIPGQRRFVKVSPGVFRSSHEITIYKVSN
jgi:hypothetical protein